MKKLLLVMGMSAIFLAGCMSDKMTLLSDRQPSQEEINSWDFGPYPENYKQLVESSPEFNKTSAIKTYTEFEGKPEKTWFKRSVGFVYGWGGFVNRYSNQNHKVKYRYLIRNNALIFIDKAIIP